MLSRLVRSQELNELMADLQRGRVVLNANHLEECAVGAGHAVAHGWHAPSMLKHHGEHPGH